MSDRIGEKAFLEIAAHPLQPMPTTLAMMAITVGDLEDHDQAESLGRKKLLADLHATRSILVRLLTEKATKAEILDTINSLVEGLPS